MKRKCFSTHLLMVLRSFSQGFHRGRFVRNSSPNTPQFSRIIYLFVQLLTSFLSLRRRRLTFYFLLQFQRNCQLLIKNQTSPKLTHFFFLSSWISHQTNKSALSTEIYLSAYGNTYKTCFGIRKLSSNPTQLAVSSLCDTRI